MFDSERNHKIAMNMKPMTQDQVMNILPLINTYELERQAGLTRLRLADVKRGKAKLSVTELEKIQKVLKQLKLNHHT
jgi:hypothetical protein